MDKILNRDQISFLDDLVKRTSKFTGWNHQWSISDSLSLVIEDRSGPNNTVKKDSTTVIGYDPYLRILTEVYGRFRHIGLNMIDDYDQIRSILEFVYSSS